MINGETVAPTFERLEIFTDPDPGMIAVFPRMGNRALIRATAVMRFDAPATTETVELTWPAYPIDQLAEQMESSSDARPRMYFEAVLTAAGKFSAARFTHAEPTIRWSRTETTATDPLLGLPVPATAGPGEDMPIMLVFLGGGALAAIGLGALRRSAGAWVSGLAIAVVVIGIGFAMRNRIALVVGGAPQPLVTEAEAEQVLRAIHESMYRAFDYTAESDIYDHLEMALDGRLLGELYEQIRLSLLQAEDEMKVGVVTGLEPLETDIVTIDPAKDTPTGLGFDAIHRWRVDGTVYHWGHSHTRAHIYEANYRVTYARGGWRITGHQLRSQQRIDPAEGKPFEEADPLQHMLDQLGQPDI